MPVKALMVVAHFYVNTKRLQFNHEYASDPDDRVQPFKLFLCDPQDGILKDNFKYWYPPNEIIMPADGRGAFNRSVFMVKPDWKFSRQQMTQYASDKTQHQRGQEWRESNKKNLWSEYTEIPSWDHYFLEVPYVLQRLTLDMMVPDKYKYSNWLEYHNGFVNLLREALRFDAYDIDISEVVPQDKWDRPEFNRFMISID